MGRYSKEESNRKREKFARVMSENPDSSLTDAAALVDVDRHTLSRWARELGIEVTQSYRKPKKLSAEEEQAIISLYLDEVPVREIQETKCVTSYLLFETLKRYKIPTRGMGSGSKNHNWKGGRHVNPDGYVEMWVSDDHPFATMKKSDGYVLEHRWVMANHIGRPLRKDETIHHIDGDPGNNKVENLQLRVQNHGPGVSLGCLDCGSFNIGANEV